MDKKIFKPSPAFFPAPAVLVSCGDMTDSNIITIAWVGVINSEPPLLSVSVRENRLSYNMIKKQGSFVVNIPSYDMCKDVDYCGVVSGSDTNKFEKLGLTRGKSENIASPIISQCPINIQCVLKNEIDLGTHHMFIGEIDCVSVNEECLDSEGKVVPSFVSYFQKRYYSVGELLGYHGYSIK